MLLFQIKYVILRKLALTDGQFIVIYPYRESPFSLSDVGGSSFGVGVADNLCLYSTAYG